MTKVQAIEKLKDLKIEAEYMLQGKEFKEEIYIYQCDKKAIEIAIDCINKNIRNDISFWKVLIIGTIFWLGFCYIVVNV